MSRTKVSEKVQELKGLVRLVEGAGEGPVVRQRWSYGAEELRYELDVYLNLLLTDEDLKFLTELSHHEIERVSPNLNEGGGGRWHNCMGASLWPMDRRIEYQYRRLWWLLHQGTEWPVPEGTPRGDIAKMIEPEVARSSAYVKSLTTVNHWDKICKDCQTNILREAKVVIDRRRGLEKGQEVHILNGHGSTACWIRVPRSAPLVHRSEMGRMPTDLPWCESCVRRAKEEGYWKEPTASRCDVSKSPWKWDRRDQCWLKADHDGPHQMF